MTKDSKLNWRLKDLPTASEIADLVDSEVITKEEAKELLFNDTQEDSRKVKALEEEVKFLRELVDTLAAKNNSWHTIVHEYRDYTPQYPYWYKSYGTLMSNLDKTPFIGYSHTSGAISSTSDNKMLTAMSVGDSKTTTFNVNSSDVKGLSSLN